MGARLRPLWDHTAFITWPHSFFSCLPNLGPVDITVHSCAFSNPMGPAACSPFTHAFSGERPPGLENLWLYIPLFDVKIGIFVLLGVNFNLILAFSGEHNNHTDCFVRLSTVWTLLQRFIAPVSATYDLSSHRFYSCTRSGVLWISQMKVRTLPVP